MHPREMPEARQADVPPAPQPRQGLKASGGPSGPAVALTPDTGYLNQGQGRRPGHQPRR